MGSIRPVSVFFLLMIFFADLPLGAQSSGSLNLVTEIQAIEQILNRSGGSGQERRGAAVRLARLYQLAGSLEDAARAWSIAAFAEPGRQDENALLEGALVQAALGEYEKAQANVNAVLSGSRDREPLLRARYIAAQIEAFSTGNIRNLARLLEENDYREYRPAILYTLWRVSGDGAHRTRLTAEYPLSPEGRIAAGDSGPGLDSAVSAVPSAMWILFPGRESITLGPPQIPPAPSLLPPVTTELPGPAVLQTGLFSREDNAQALVRRLAAAGFSAALTRRRVNSTEYWAVMVPAGADMQQTIMRLKNAGFESFPVN